MSRRHHHHHHQGLQFLGLTVIVLVAGFWPVSLSTSRGVQWGLLLCWWAFAALAALGIRQLRASRRAASDARHPAAPQVTVRVTKH